MARPLSKRDLDILEEGGYWKALSSLHKKVKRLVRKNLLLDIGLIKEAHKIVFVTAHQNGMAGKYRRDNPELKRIDGTELKITHWQQIPNQMAELDAELKERTKNLRPPQNDNSYRKIIEIAARLSHRLACIHPFENGNGRASRLLLNAILLRAGLLEVAIKGSKDAYLRAMRQADDGDFSMLKKMISRALLENQHRLYKSLLRKKAESSRRKR